MKKKFEDNGVLQKLRDKAAPKDKSFIKKARVTSKAASKKYKLITLKQLKEYMRNN